MPKSENYQRYVRNVHKLLAFDQAGKFDTDEADLVREEMADQWYALSQEERKEMDRMENYRGNLKRAQKLFEVQY